MGALPIAGERRDRRERADSIANRDRIVAAARALFAERGAEGASMDAVAAAAGVGKGTLFRHFGDRAGLTVALLDDEMTAFQNAFLFGPPPLGPGAPAAQRLEAFAAEFLRVLDTYRYLVVAASRAADDSGGLVFGALALHVRMLLEQVDPTLDHHVVADLLLGALLGGVLKRARDDRAVSLERLQAASKALVRGVVPCPPERLSS